MSNDRLLWEDTGNVDRVASKEFPYPVQLAGGEGGGSTPAGIVQAVSKPLIIQAEPVLAAATYTLGNILFDWVALAAAVAVADDGCILESVTVVDKDAVGAALDLYVAAVNNSLGAANTLAGITDANIVASKVQKVGSILASDYSLLSGARIATLSNLALPVASSGSTSIFLGAINQGTPTHTATGMTLFAGILR